MNATTETTIITCTFFSFEEIVDKMQEEIKNYKRTGRRKELLSWCTVLQAKNMMKEKCDGDPKKFIEMLRRAEASKRLFETNPQ